ncbi:MAG TPA: caspase family protein, partial [Candidatus Sulfotelmatobacter sp.]|nr:caspase family protein [Candidatus Sulfotelmatobacter sp.]
MQTGHLAEIQGLEYAANGKFFVSAGKDSTIKLWSPGGTLIRTIRTGFWVDYLALSHDNQLLLAATRTGNIFLLSLDGRVVHRFPDIPMMEGFVSAVALSDDNRHAAIGTTRGLVLYRLDGAVEARLQPEGDTSQVESVLYTRDGRLISGHPDGKLRFWTDEGKLLHTVAAHEYSVRALALSPDGKTLATAGTPILFAEIPKNIKPLTKLWDLDGNPLGQFPSQFTQCLRFSADGANLVSGGRSDNEVHIYRKSGELVRTIKVGVGANRSPYLIALAPDGRTLITADDNIDPPGLEIWNIDGSFERVLVGLSGPMTNVVTSPDGNFIVTLSADRLVRIWSLDGRLMDSLPGHKQYPTGLAYAPNGQYFASGGDEVILWSRFGQKLNEFTGFKNGAGVLAFSPDSRFLFCGDGGGSVHIYDLEQKSLRHLKAHDGRVYALAIAPSGKYFATGSSREEVRIWDFEGKLQGESRFDQKATRPVSPTYSLAFAPEGDKLVAATTNPEKSLQVFDLKAQLVDSIKLSNSYQGGAITFSKSGRWLAATANSTVTLWDWPTRKLVRVLKGHGDFIEGLSFTPDEQHIVSAGHDATTRVWRVDNGYSMALLAHGGDWIVYTPDGYFDSSHYGGDLVGITRGLDTYAVDQFALQLNRPDLILSRMGIGSPEFIEHLHSRYERRLERSGFHVSVQSPSLEAPEVHLLEAKQDGKFAQIEADISDQHCPLQAYQIYVNNVPIFRGQGKTVTGLKARLSERIELGQGENKIEISAFNSQGVEALRAHWSTIYRPDSKDVRGDLYYVGFGISHYRNPALNLQFAHKDVLDLGATLQRYEGSFRHVIEKTYVDDAVTRDNILKAGELLKNAGVDDTVIILVSGHGAYDLSKEATYYYGTYNIDIKNLAATAVSFDEIESLLRDIAPRRKLLLLDTCESGEMDESTRTELTTKMRDAGLAARTSPVFQQAHAGQTKRVFLYERDRYIYNDLARRTGSIIFSAAHAGEMSFESSKVQNGFFTHEILEALGSAQADANQDGKISIDELEAFVSLKVAL